MKYIVVSNRVGTPGEEFVPTEGTNIQALLWGGFITEVSTPKPKKTSTVKKATKE